MSAKEYSITKLGKMGIGYPRELQKFIKSRDFRDYEDKLSRRWDRQGEKLICYITGTVNDISESLADWVSEQERQKTYERVLNRIIDNNAKYNRKRFKSEKSGK